MLELKCPYDLFEGATHKDCYSDTKYYEPNHQIG